MTGVNEQERVLKSGPADTLEVYRVLQVMNADANQRDVRSDSGRRLDVVLDIVSEVRLVTGYLVGNTYD